MSYPKLVTMLIAIFAVSAFGVDTYTNQLIATFHASRTTYVPVTELDLATRKKEVEKALRNFEDVLALSKGEADEWKNIFRLRDLRKEMDAGRSANQETLEEIDRLFYEDVEGIENPVVLALRAAFGRYKNAVYYTSLPDGTATFTKTVDELNLWLAKHSDNPTAETSYQVGKRLGWLERGGQLLTLVQQTHARYSNANFRLRIAKTYIEDNFKKEINDKSPVNEVIRGADVRGQALTQGSTHLELIPSDQAAVLRVVMNGTMTSKSLATKTEYGPLGRPIYVQVPSTGQSVVRVEKEFHLTGDKFVPLPARAGVNTSSNFLSVNSSARLPIVRGFIAKKAYEEKPLGDLEAARKAEAKLREKADDVPQPESFKDLSQLYKEYFQTPQVRTGTAPMSAVWTSREDYIQQNLVQRSPYQLAAPTLPPNPSKPFHFAAFIHQSQANNLISPMFGGKWSTDDDFGLTFKIIFGFTPKQFRLGSHMARWSAKLDKIRPIQVEFYDGKATVKIFGDALKAGDEKSNEPFVVTATYRVKLHPVHGPEFEREGDIEVKAADAKTEKFLLQKFGDLYGKHLAPDGLVPPDGGKFEDLRAFKISELTTYGGWMVFTFSEDKHRKKTVDKK